MKGITPIIAIIILLLITVAIAGAAWTFLYGYISPMTTAAFIIPPGGAFCVESSGTNVITVQISNNGQSTLKAEDFTIVQVAGEQINTTSYPANLLPNDADGMVKPGESAVLFRNYDCGSTCISTTVDVATASTVLHQPVTCP